MGIFDRIRRRFARPGAPDRVVVGADVQARFDAFDRAAGGASFTETHDDLVEGRAILDSSSAEQVETLLLCFDRIANMSFPCNGTQLELLKSLASRLLQRRHDYADDDLAQLVLLAARQPQWVPYKRVLGAIEKRLDGAVPEGKLAFSLTVLRTALANAGDAESTQAVPRVDAILEGPSGGETLALEAVDAWTTALAAALADDDARARFTPLLQHCARATSAKPTKRWLDEARKRVDTMGVDEHGRVMEAVLTAVGTPWTKEVLVPDSSRPGKWLRAEPVVIAPQYADLLRGLVWSCVVGDADARIVDLGDAAERCFKKLEWHGPLNPKVGNACLFALSECGSRDGVGQLTRLKTRVRHASARDQVEKALRTAARRAGLSTSDLEDIAVPTCGLTEVGRLTQEIGAFTAELAVTDAGSAQIAWIKANGKRQKTVPKAVKEEHADELKALKKTQKDVKQSYLAQRRRIERLFASERTLPFADWRARYLDHPLVGHLARRLVWRMANGDEVTPVSCVNGALQDVDGGEVQPSDDTVVRLWHPIDSPADTVHAWRDRLRALEVVQPFKQAHREIYVVTEAERGTEIYSNRFAAHVLKQHQFHALCQERGWSFTLMGAWDSHNTPHVRVPEHDLTVEFWVDFAEGLEDETSGSAVYLYILTDQVRFVREGAPMRLDEVPPIAFSELMRDVDLFVGVCSVGNDPTWRDSGPEGRYMGYWDTISFGDLNQSAVTRRAVLEQLLPSLKIADVCTLEERFLVVRGKRRTYKIHLGSSNILMSPNDEYLCIVPGRKAGTSASRVMLPFEGDTVLSTILSKAFLLAADDQITDRTILSQIDRR